MIHDRSLTKHHKPQLSPTDQYRCRIRQWRVVVLAQTDGLLLKLKRDKGDNSGKFSGKEQNEAPSGRLAYVSPRLLLTDGMTGDWAGGSGLSTADASPSFPSSSDAAGLLKHGDEYSSHCDHIFVTGATLDYSFVGSPASEMT